MEYRTQILIAGGGLGGCAAALAAARSGAQVILTEETAWIGGQLTSQAVPPDEHGWIERFGCTASYRALRENIRDFYRRYYPLRPEARQDPFLNPGNGWVSPLCHEPRVALAVLESMLAPDEAAGRLTILRGMRPVAADVDGDRVRSVLFETGGERAIVHAELFIDATELGDLLPITGTEHVTGFESSADTGEPSAPDTAQPGNVQAFSVCFILEHRDGADFRGDRPGRYDYWRDYVPRLQPAWPGRLLDWVTPNPRTMQPNRYRFAPHGEKPVAFSGLWTYRRIADRSLFTDGFYASDLCLVNWPLIDYLDGDLCTAGEAERVRFLREARELGHCVVYWLQNDAPRADGGAGWPGLRLRGDLTGASDGLAMAPYIRESRRILPRVRITEQDVSATLREGETYAAAFPDSVGIGYYRIDLHPSTGGNNYIDVPALPFQIPLGALLPRRVANLIAGAKNIGTTHITNGCYRLHPVEWNIGEAAGALAAYCLRRGLPPSAVHGSPASLQEFQEELVRQGVELAWPRDLQLDQGDPHIHAAGA